MITAPLPRASPSGSGRLSMIIPRYYGLTITYIRHCGSTLYVGLTGIVQRLIQKSMGWLHPFQLLFFCILRDEYGW